VSARFLALILILLAACGKKGTDASPPTDSDTISPPVGEPPSDEPDTAAAQAVVHEYYAAIAAGQYRRAYLLWGDSGRLSNQTFQQFRTGFRNTASVRVQVGEPGRIEGAAGSRYIEIPVEIEAFTDDGAMQRFSGTYTLRRVVVDGATESQRRWHLYDAEITPCPDGCANMDSAAAEVVRRFGSRLRMVSLLGPEAVVVTAIREHYAPLITAELLARWTANPAASVGREVSSPWPQRAAITAVEDQAERGQVVRADIVYVTSSDTTAVVYREPVTFRVTLGADRR